MEVHVILHNIRSVYNVGSIFRTADAAGVGRIYLTGYTPAPVDRFGRARKNFAKVSLGAEKSVPWEERRSVLALIRELKEKRVMVVALEQDARSVDYTIARARRNTALIAGNETEGLPKHILKLCDVVAEIPMRGAKESLNVSVAVGIALFHFVHGKRQ